MDEIYVSVDIETDGPIPGIYSMLSLGAAAYKLPNVLVDTFTTNLQTLPGAEQDPDTMKWWKTQPEAWEACRKDPEDAFSAMKAFAKWVKRLPGKPVFVGAPAGFDFTFVYWYLIRYNGSSPFSFSAIDMKTLAMALLKAKKGYRGAVKRNYPKRWFDSFPHTHIALDDAIEQGAIFCNMMADLK